MTFQNEAGPAGRIQTDPRSDLPLTKSAHLTACAHPLQRVFDSLRRNLARWIAPKGDLFSPDMSLALDALVVENERLRQQIAGQA